MLCLQIRGGKKKSGLGLEIAGLTLAFVTYPPSKNEPSTEPIHQGNQGLRRRSEC